MMTMMIYIVATHGKDDERYKLKLQNTH